MPKMTLENHDYNQITLRINDRQRKILFYALKQAGLKSFQAFFLSSALEKAREIITFHNSVLKKTTTSQENKGSVAGPIDEGESHAGGLDVI